MVRLYRFDRSRPRRRRVFLGGSLFRWEEWTLIFCVSSLLHML
jgi:hypothetical protein